MSAGAPRSVPGEWTRELLQDHVSEIVFDNVERVELDCVLCQQAALAGLWDPWYDEDEADSDWLPELRRRGGGAVSGLEPPIPPRPVGPGISAKGQE